MRTEDACGGPARLRRRIALAYAKERRTFGRAIVQYQYIQGMLTEMALSNELGRAAGHER